MKTDNHLQYNELTPDEKRVIEGKGTERPFTGEYYDHFEKGTYTCRKCDLPLYHSTDKFKSGCGWPSFDDEIPGAVKKIPDKDGIRTEILCAYCGAHLGHVFTGENLTSKNVRHCVNSISMNFVPDGEQLKRERAIFAAGCFWGVEHLFKGIKGVLDTRVGYIGGKNENPTYDQVCSKTTGHAEAVEIIYDPGIVSFEELVKFFFEIHDFTQVNRQGPDVGDQYRSEIFYTLEKQRETAQKYVEMLKDKGYSVATGITKATAFWEGEDYHQDYYEKTGKHPYCHYKRNVFNE
ncbi:bifunctional methionine sulfoxide reductase B/A protein [bacterium]|nr:bifunctional methionine sulfoxide reductase B/A protein [bacterium]